MPNTGATLPVDLGPGIQACFTARGEGVGSGQTSGFDLSPRSADQRRVAENRKRLGASFDAPLIGMNQVHGAEIAVVNSTHLGQPAPTADGLVTSDSSVALLVLVADCVPILLADADSGLVAAIHAGRLGVQSGVIIAAVKKMREAGASEENIRGAIGPAICGECYEVPLPMRDEFAAQILTSASQTRWGTPALNLPAAVEYQLRASGVTSIQNLNMCTFESKNLYSYRRSPETGRQAGVIRLRK